MKYILALIIILPCTLQAQLYMNMSANLPNNGAKGSSMDVRAADLDNDGDKDIILANEFQANTILMNDGEGIFLNASINNLQQVIRDSEDVTIADFNGDGILDLIFCSEDDVVLGGSNVHEYYFGNEDGKYTSSGIQLPDSEANAVVSADVNGDGFIDVFLGNNGINYLLLNDGDGNFELSDDRLPSIHRTTQDLALGDIDGDGDLDLFEGNENGNVLWLNQGGGYFSDVSESHLPQGLNIETRKVSFGDIDGDEDLDVFLSNVEFIPGKDRQNRLLLNDGNGVFSDVTSTNLPVDNDYTLDAIFEDIDLDKDLDIIVCNFAGAPIKVYENDGLGHFKDMTIEVMGQLYVRDALGVVVNDFNDDGFNDIYICDRKNQISNNKDLLLFRNPVVDSNNNLNPERFGINVMPNPGTDIFIIQMKKEIPKSIVVTNHSGEVLKTLEVMANDSMRIDLSTFPSGQYFFVANFGNNQQVAAKVLKK